MKASEIRDLQASEIENQIGKIREQLFKYRFHSGNDEMQRAGEIRTLRRDLARLKTIQRERILAVVSQQDAGPEKEAEGGG